MEAGGSGRGARRSKIFLVRTRIVAGAGAGYHPAAMEEAVSEGDEVTLRARVARLTAEIERQTRWTRQVLRAALEGFHVVSHDGRILDCNEAFAAHVGYPHDVLLRMNIAEIDPRTREELAEAIEALMAGGGGRFVTMHRHRDGRLLDVEVSVHFADIDGEPVLVAFSHPIGEQIARERALRQAEAERAALQAQVIAAQAATIRELSTPLIPIGDGVLVVPIVGRIDHVRANVLLERLLAGVAERRAHAAILDLTGVAEIDAEAANGLVQVARAVRLLGATAVVTGVHPAVARTLIALNVDLAGLVTLDSLQSGLRYVEELGRGGRPE